jgi:hypothetical protein
MTALEGIFTALAVASFLAVAWICGVVVWRLLKVSKR